MDTEVFSRMHLFSPSAFIWWVALNDLNGPNNAKIFQCKNKFSNVFCSRVTCVRNKIKKRVSSCQRMITHLFVISDHWEMNLFSVEIVNSPAFEPRPWKREIWYCFLSYQFQVQFCEAIFFALDNPSFFRLGENFHGKIERIPIRQLALGLREPNILLWLEIQLIIKRSESKLRRFGVILTPLSGREKRITVEMLTCSVKGVRTYQSVARSNYELKLSLDGLRWIHNLVAWLLGLY